MILYSGSCEACDYTWDDEPHQYERCPNCGLSDISKWAYVVKGNLRKPWEPKVKNDRRLSDVK